MHQYQCFEELIMESTDTCAIDYEKGNTLGKKKSYYKVYYKNKLHSMCPWT